MVGPVLPAISGMLTRTPRSLLLLLLRFSLSRHRMTWLLDLRLLLRVWSHVYLLAGCLLPLSVLTPGMLPTAIAMVLLLGSHVLTHTSFI